jgi:hypothetical protein
MLSTDPFPVLRIREISATKDAKRGMLTAGNVSQVALKSKNPCNFANIRELAGGDLSTYDWPHLHSSLVSTSVRFEACEPEPHQLIRGHVRHAAPLQALDIVRRDSVDSKIDDVFGR